MPVFNGTLHEIDKNETKRYAGLRRGGEFPDALVEDACSAVLAIAEPRGIYRQYPYDPVAHRLLCTPPFLIEGKQVQKHLGQSEQAVVMAVTAGSAVEAEIDRMFAEKNYTQGLLMDAAATTAAEMIADQLNRYIDGLAAKNGYMTTWRYSPGYGDWPLLQQPEMVRAVHAGDIGISVTTGCMLLPRKSVTAIIGLRRAEGKDCSLQGCAVCSMRDSCASRKE